MKKYKLRNKKNGAITFTDDVDFDRDKFELLDEIKTSKNLHNQIRHT